MKYLLFLLFLFSEKRIFSQEIPLISKKLLGIEKIAIGQNLDSIKAFFKSPNDKAKQKLTPISVQYELFNYSVSNETLEMAHIYFNTDSSKKVSAIIIEFKKEQDLNIVDSIFVNSLGNYTSKTSFKSAFTSTEWRGWILKDYGIILITGYVSMVIIYNNDKKSFFKGIN